MSEWTTLPDLPEANAEFALVKLGDGRLVIAGGDRNGDPFFHKTAWISNSAVTSWTALDDLPHRLAQPSGILMSGGDVLVVGTTMADDNTFAGVAKGYRLDVSMGSWTATGDYPDGVYRRNGGLVELANGKIMYVGGFDPNTGQALAACPIYDPAMNTWATGPVLNAARVIGWNAISPAIRLDDDTIFVCGGRDPAEVGNLDSAEICDSAATAWTTIGATMLHARLAQQMIKLSNGKVLVFGGFNSIATSIVEAELFDPSGGGSFSSAGNTSTGHADAGASLLDDGTVVVSGGWDDTANAPIATTEVWDPDSNTWTTHDADPTGRYAHIGIGNTTYFLGGFDTGETLLALVESWDEQDQPEPEPPPEEFPSGKDSITIQMTCTLSDGRQFAFVVGINSLTGKTFLQVT